ncbi:helix-turn-helix transcriptional regulator [Bacillus sp. V5-8f]|uniref:helix-turn-helix domain-containing protein n=1 Tax=Bacillus sp. V5-8f TaxID=2053044 RepID=UPI000C77FFC7|nr:helix-turn-helix transcriptional regulator [Bacillus sp. V5-8f]PLT32872.1 transcriptional regulator [Bacillus sp. V5-8f]
MFWERKTRSKLGKFLDKEGYSQEELVKASKVSRNTVSRICTNPDYVPSGNVIKKIMKAIRQIDPGAKTEDFFDI